MNFETIVITAGVGSLAGWLIGLVMKRSGYELIVDTALGVAGGVVGGSALQAIVAADTRLPMTATAVVGAFIVIVVHRKFWNVETAAMP
jgi:uncharacterized membrane protein YeaQ/YmgE (transglycosylase-associated protein family)